MYKYDISEEFKTYVEMWERSGKDLTGEEAIKRMVENSAMGRRVWAANSTDQEVKITKQQIKSFDGEQIEIQMIAPHEIECGAPCLMYYHGGAFVAPALDFHRRLVKEYAMGAKCKVIYVDYRLAFEHPFPVGIEDCYSALEWVIANAEQIGIDTNRIAVAGDSSGGAIAAAIAQMIRDRRSKKLCFQMLCYPVIDCRQNTLSMKTFVDTPVWNAPMNNYMWQVYLREGVRDIRNGQDDMLPYASPMLAKHFDDLPPAYIELTEFDPVRDEGRAYGELLRAHHIPVTIYQTIGTIHGYDAVRNSHITKENIQRRIEVLSEAFKK